MVDVGITYRSTDAEQVNVIATAILGLLYALCCVAAVAVVPVVRARYHIPHQVPGVWYTTRAAAVVVVFVYGHYVLLLAIGPVDGLMVLVYDTSPHRMYLPHSCYYYEYYNTILLRVFIIILFNTILILVVLLLYSCFWCKYSSRISIIAVRLLYEYTRRYDTYEDVYE